MLTAEMRRTKIYDERDYWEQLVHDVLNAKGSVIIYSPFATVHGIRRWTDLINALIASGRTVHIITGNTAERQPQIFESAAAEARRKQIEAVTDWIKRVTPFWELRDNVHPKFVIIDETILWEGSLNFLSHYATREHLRRTISREDVKEVMMRHEMKIGSASMDESLEELASALKARREECGMSQSEVARRLGVQASQISRLESGGTRTIHATIRALLDLLDLRVLLVPSYLYTSMKHILRETHNRGE